MRREIYRQMETVYKKRLAHVSRISANEESCEVKLKILLADSPVIVKGKAWGHAGYKKNPLVFVPIDADSSEKAVIISRLDHAYGEMELDVAVWAVEFQLFVRMLMDGYLLINPYYMDSCYLAEQVVLPALTLPSREKLSVDTPLGKIESSVIPDLEYPGIYLLYKNNNGEPGAVMEYSPNRDMVQMRIYSAENPEGGEPAAIYDMVLPEEKELIKMVDNMVEPGKITDSAVITCKQDHTGTYVDVNYKYDPVTEDYTDYVTVFASITGEEDTETAWEEAERIADAAATLFGLKIIKERG